jgi:hypothetical protein
MMPSREQRWLDAARARESLFQPRPEPAAAPPPTGIETAEAAAARGYARGRVARIRRGACPVCAERRCPRVGGPDVACVVG